MDNTTVAENDRFIAVVLASDDKEAALPVDKLPLDDIRIALNDGRMIHVRHLPGGHVVQVTDLDGDTIAELAIPAQKESLTIKATKLRKAAERMAEALNDVAKEAVDAIKEINRDEATELPAIALPGPKAVN